MSNKKSAFKDHRGHHIRVYSEVYDSPAFKALTPPDVMAYLALMRDLKGTNNGDLSLTLTKAKERGIGHHTTLARSLRALCAVGLIYQTRKGGATRGGQRLPSLYAVTDVDVYEMRHKQVEARKADFAWRKVTTIEHAQSLIDQAESTKKKAPPKLKSLGHKLTATRLLNDVITPNIRLSNDTWNEQPGYLLTHGKNTSNPISMRVSGQFDDEQDFQNHRTLFVSPIQVATPMGGIGPATVTELEAIQHPGNYQRLTKPLNGRGWLPAGLGDSELVPDAVCRKALKHLSTLDSKGPYAATAIQAARDAGVSIEQLCAWADSQTVVQALAKGTRHWRDLWTHTAVVSA